MQLVALLFFAIPTTLGAVSANPQSEPSPSPFITYSRSGGFLGDTLSIQIEANGKYVVHHKPAGDGKGSKRTGTLSQASLGELKTKVMAMPVYQAPREDWFGADFYIYSVALGKDDKHCVWTDISSDVPARVLGVAQAIEKATQQRRDHKPIEILDITLSVEESDPPNLVISVTGEAPTDGWEAYLNQHYYFVPPANGMWEFDLVGIAPVATKPPKKTKVTTEFRWMAYPAKDVKGVIVNGADGSAVKKRVQ